MPSYYFLQIESLQQAKQQELMKFVQSLSRNVKKTLQNHVEEIL